MKFFTSLLVILLSTQAYSQFDGRFKAKEVKYSKDDVEINISTTKLIPYKANVQKMNWTTSESGESIAKFSVDLEGVITPFDSSSGEDPETLIVGITHTESYEVKFQEERLYTMEMFDYTNENLSYQEASLKVGSYNLMSKIGKTKNAKSIEITIKQSDITADEIQLVVFKGTRMDFYELFATTYTSTKEINYSQSPIEIEVSQDVIEFTTINIKQLEWSSNYSNEQYIILKSKLKSELNHLDFANKNIDDPETIHIFISNLSDMELTYYHRGMLKAEFNSDSINSTGIYKILKHLRISMEATGKINNVLEILIKKSDIRAKNIQICVFRGKKSEFEQQLKALNP